MNSSFFLNRISWRLSVALMLTLALAGSLGQAKELGEQPIGWSKARVGNSPIKPLYASEIVKDATDVQARVNEMAQTVETAKVNPEADSVEQALPGSLSLERHKADIAAIRDKFSLCLAAMSHQIHDAEATGKATPADRQRFDSCLAHCNQILRTMDDMHTNTSVMLTATKKIYFLNAWEKHKKLMARLQDEMKNCPMMMKDTEACCMALTSGSGASSKPGSGAGKK